MSMIRSYELMITSDVKLINKKIYNIGFDNFPVVEIATVKTIIGKNVELNLVPTNDIRSYHISSKKIKDELGFTPLKNIDDAIIDFKNALRMDCFPIHWMQNILILKQ